MKKLLSILFFLCITQFSYSQTFTQTFVDRCTGEVQVVTANFTSGSAIVSFYNEAKIFTYQQYTNGELQQWLVQKYAWWQALSPCSTNNATNNTTQQTTQNATTNATNAANNATSNATNHATSGKTQTTTTGTCLLNTPEAADSRH